MALGKTDFDAVVITTPTFTHAEIAAKAASSGKSILCEKPMALTLDECDRMIEAASQKQVVLQIGFMRRFDPPFVEAKKQIDAGLIGRPLIIRTLTRGPGLPPAWAHDVRRSHGILAEVNSHDFDCIRWFSGGEYVSVFSRAAARKALEVRAQYPEFYDTVLLSAELDNGVFAVLDGVCPVDYGYDARAEVVGSEGVLLVGEMHQTATTRVTRRDGLVEDHFLAWRERFAQAYANEATHFVETIRGMRPPAATGLDGRRALEAVIAGNRSIATGQPVSLPLGS
jgi:myo-inositol 2-dehydrogenase/D-chiro-inositol 1-dehydrogenase/scyllo-inositol 2-dehydrogenase (NAD+)